MANPTRDIGYDSLLYAVEFAPGYSPLDPAPVWVDIAADVRAADGITVTRGTTSPFADSQPGTMTLTLNNRARKYDPDYTAGTYYPNLVPMTPIRLVVRQSAVNYPIFYGFVQGFEQGYAPPREAICTITAVDLFGLLNVKQMPVTALDVAVLADTPSAYYPMLEELVTVAEDVTGNGYDGIYTSHHAALTSTDTFLTGELGQKAKTLTDTQFAGTYDVFNVPQSGVSTIMAVEAWLRLDVAPLNSLGVDSWEIDGFSPNSIIVITASNDGTDRLFHFVCADTTVGLADLTVPMTTGTIYHVAAVINTAKTLFTAYVNGQVVATADISAGTFTGGTRTGYFGMFTDELVTVEMGHAAFYGAQLTAAQVLNHYLLGTNGGYLDTTADRMTDLADYAGLVAAGLYSGSTLAANTYLAAASFSGDVLTAMQDVMRSEQGRLFVNASGVLTAQGRTADMGEKTENSVSNGTWSDSGTSAYAAIHSIPGHVDTMKNTEYVTAGGATVKATDSTAVTRYGELSESVSTVLADPTAGRNLGLSRIRRFKDPTTRVNQVLIRPHGSSDTRYAKAFLVDLGWRYVTSITPQAVGSAITKTGSVEGITHTVNEAKWETLLYLVPAQDIYSTHPWFRMGDATYGRIGAAAANALAY